MFRLFTSTSQILQWRLSNHLHPPLQLQCRLERTHDSPPCGSGELLKYLDPVTSVSSSDPPDLEEVSSAFSHLQPFITTNRFWTPSGNSGFWLLASLGGITPNVIISSWSLIIKHSLCITLMCYIWNNIILLSFGLSLMKYMKYVNTQQ